MSTTLRETCGCGATFTTTTATSSLADYSAKKWREGHQHAESVGICGDTPPPLMVGDRELPRWNCVLKAGHAGMHEDGQGSHWADRPKITNHDDGEADRG